MRNVANENKRDFNDMLHDSKDVSKLQTSTDQKKIVIRDFSWHVVRLVPVFLKTIVKMRERII